MSAPISYPRLLTFLGGVAVGLAAPRLRRRFKMLTTLAEGKITVDGDNVVVCGTAKTEGFVVVRDSRRLHEPIWEELVPAGPFQMAIPIPNTTDASFTLAFRESDPVTDAQEVVVATT
jgi:hypothetical protein